MAASEADVERGSDLVAQWIERVIVIGNPCSEAVVNTTELDPSNPDLQFECAVFDVPRSGTSTSTGTRQSEIRAAEARPFAVTNVVRYGMIPAAVSFA